MSTAPSSALDEAVFDDARRGPAAHLAARLDAGVPVDARNRNGDTLLMLASYNGNATAVELLLARGADAALANPKGQRPLAAAAFKEDIGILTRLLDGGAPVDAAGPDGRTALFMAAQFNRTAAVALLLARGADPTRRDNRGLTAAEAARAAGAPETPAQIEAATPHAG